MGIGVETYDLDPCFSFGSLVEYGSTSLAHDFAT